MIASIAVHSLLLGVVLSLCAAAFERVLVALSSRAGRAPARRFVWLAAMAASVLVPLVTGVRPAPGPVEAVVVVGEVIPVGGVAVAPETTVWQDAGAMMLGAAAFLVRAASAALETAGTALNGWFLALGSSILVGWVLASMVLLAVLARLTVRLHGERRGWKESSVDRVPVLLSENAGPAVIGFWKGSIVLPSWLLELGAPLRALVLRHELEHVRARDPGVLSAAVACLLFQPWNPALWWQFRRLRMAVELDCDARVLSGGADVERYGLLLLAVGQRTRRNLTPVAALAEDRTLLARRIATMSEPRTKTSLTRVALWGALATAGVLVACELPSGERLASPNEEASPSAAVAGPDGAYFEFQVDKPVSAAANSAQPRYPELARTSGMAGTVLAQFVVDTSGTVITDSFQVIDSDDALFTEAVRQALPRMRFHAAEVGGHKVKQLVQLPFVFAIDGESPSQSSRRAPAAEPPPAPVPSASLAARSGSTATDAPPPPPSRSGGQVYFEFQVDKQVVHAADTQHPRYPADLREAGISGQVLAEFVVGTDGRVDTRTFRVMESDNEGFTEAVRSALPRMRFVPAEVGGVAVRQLVQQPFVFAIQ